MKKTVFLIGLLGVLICGCHPSGNLTVKFSPKSSDYTNIVQDIAVFQESCQNKISGRYYSELYDFTFSHDQEGICHVKYGSGFVVFTVTLDDQADHVVIQMQVKNFAKAVYDVHRYHKGINNYYIGTRTGPAHLRNS